MAEQDDDVFEITASKTEGSFDADDKTIDESIDGQDGVSYFKYLILFIHLYRSIHRNKCINRYNKRWHMDNMHLVYQNLMHCYYFQW